MECFNWRKLRDIIFIICALYFLYLLSYHWIMGGATGPNHYRYEHHLKMDSVQMKELKDTLYLHQIMDRADSIANANRIISERYQDDVNLMIYKATQWVTIWLGIMAIVAGGIAVNQVYNHRKAAADRKELEGKLSEYETKTTNAVDKRITKYQSILNNYAKTLIDEKSSDLALMKEKMDEMNGKINDTDREMKISTLVTCISTFPDPSMFTSKPEKKDFLRYYLLSLYDEFKQYAQNFNEGTPTLNEVNRLSVVLTSVKYVIVRSRSIFPGYHQNITYNQLCKAIDTPLKKIVDGGVGAKGLNNDLAAILEMFGRMIRDISIEGTII